MAKFKRYAEVVGLSFICLAAVPVLGIAPMQAAAATDEAKMSDADKLAKAQDCSKQADAKKLHGEARKKFRAACKKG